MSSGLEPRDLVFVSLGIRAGTLREHAARGIRRGVLVVLVQHADRVRSPWLPSASDVSIADLAVAWNAAMIKAGVRGGGRIPKLNELIRIEQAVAGIKLASFPIR